MKMKHLIFALLTAASASSFTGCNENTPDPKASEPCLTCENETIVDSIFSQEATVKIHNTEYPNAENRYILSIQKAFSEGENYAISIDSLFLVCPVLPEEYRQAGKKVIVDLAITNCTQILTDRSSHIGYGTKANIISIKSK